MKKTVLGSGFRVLGFRFSVFGGHFQGLRLKESPSLIFAKIWGKNVGLENYFASVSITITLFEGKGSNFNRAYC
jgi:hypothetical protein